MNLRKTARDSLAYFVHPNFETIVEPLTEGPESYEPVKAGAYASERIAATYHH